MPPKVSVVMPAYNVSRFIHRSLDSVIAQQTTFEFEIIVAEDCSTDDTREIAQEYARRYPTLIRLLLQKRNRGLTLNISSAFPIAYGEYIALIDPDDYCTDPLKLQKQADFLDQHADCAYCCHAARLVHADGTVGFSRVDHPKLIFTMHELLANKDGIFWMAKSSMFFRASCMKLIPEKNYAPTHDDVTFKPILAQHGTVGYIDEFMIDYNLHGSGISSRESRLEQAKTMLDCLEIIKAVVPPNVFPLVDQFELSYSIFVLGIKKDRVNFPVYYWTLLHYFRLRNLRRLKVMVAFGIDFYVPSLLNYWRMIKLVRR